MRAIGERLRLTRDALGLTQERFCARAEISPTAYNQWERGHKRPSVDAGIALCNAYDLTLDWIYRGDPSGLKYATANAIKALKNSRG